MGVETGRTVFYKTPWPCCVSSLCQFHGFHIERLIHTPRTNVIKCALQLKGSCEHVEDPMYRALKIETARPGSENQYPGEYWRGEKGGCDADTRGIESRSRRSDLKRRRTSAREASSLSEEGAFTSHQSQMLPLVGPIDRYCHEIVKG
jgi:hypothetical protein